MMRCQECEKNPATLHFTKIVNGQMTEFHLCESCAKEKGDFFTDHGSFSIHQLLSSLMNMDNLGVPNAQGRQLIRCEHCGMTQQQFSKGGRFGCSQCYHYFRDYLDPLFRRIHGSTTHAGKVPQKAGGHLRIKKQVEELKRQLQVYIQREEFEKAAEIRDRIRSLEKELNGA